MEVVPTNDGDDDDGVVWFRCPQCQGFLPKLKGALDAEAAAAAEESKPTPAASKEESLRWDSPAAMMEDLQDSSAEAEPVDSSPLQPESDDDVLVGMIPAETSEPVGVLPVEVDEVIDEPENSGQKEEKSSQEDTEPILEYAAMLADMDVLEAAPYRPWEVYEVGNCINHLAWNDCGVVVAKEELPGGRKIIKCYFEEAGIVRLIEQAPR